MLVIGLTGGIASGKSTVAAMLRELGALVIDADQVAREIVAPGQPAWQEIRERFGPGIIKPDGEIDRRALGERVFSDPEALAELNRITHPRIRQRIAAKVEELKQKGTTKILVIEAPLLIETGMQVGVDEIWLTVAPEEVRLQRIKERDNLSEEAARRRLAAQMPQEEKLRYATRVIDTGGSLAATREQVLAAWEACRQGKV
ncbi:MAG: dephospho-CoA kinase [Clostridia bacterium]|nr:dephospho-CoA kinase [Clostridia bacterium]